MNKNMKSKPKKMQKDKEAKTLKTCGACMCSDNGKCFAYAFKGKSGKPTPCQVAFHACPDFIEKSENCEDEY